MARKVKGEHEQEKHNTSYASKFGIVNDVSSDQAGNDNSDAKSPIMDPWSKWVKMQQHLMADVKRTQSEPKQTSDRVPTGVRRRSSKSTNTSGQWSQQQGNSQISDTARNALTQTRSGNDQSQIECYNCQGCGHMHHECLSAQNSRSLNSQRRCSRTSPQHPD